jgi:hypothetical protein
MITLGAVYAAGPVLVEATFEDYRGTPFIHQLPGPAALSGRAGELGRNGIESCE